MKFKGLKFVFVFVVGLSLILSACGTDAAATEAPVSDDVVAAYEFTNTGEVEICELYLSPTGIEEWGPDQLGDATIVTSGTFTLTDIPAGTYDAKVVGCGGEESVAQLDIYNQ